ncbi:MAG TPA: hypothetical protein VIH00_10670, partial [Candidatus Limnocylindrales bacterium]
MSRGRAALAVLVGAVLAGACEYVVVPPDDGAAAEVTSEGWTGIATAIGTTDAGDLRIDLAIENRTGDWSAMAAAEAPARLAGGDGST